MTVLETENLTHYYENGMAGAVAAIENINVKFEKGEIVGIIGHTGSGKSTLLQHLNGLLKPDSGRVLLCGEDINKDKRTLRAARFRVGLCFQYPEYQLFEETVYKDISFGPKNMGLDSAEIDRRVRRAAEFVGLSEEHLKKSPFDLSGGEKRRAAIAGVMAMEPEVLILDEPTAVSTARQRGHSLACPHLSRSDGEHCYPRFPQHGGCRQDRRQSPGAQPFPCCDVRHRARSLFPHGRA